MPGKRNTPLFMEIMGWWRGIRAGFVGCWMDSIKSPIDCEANRKFKGNEMELEEKGKAECFFINLKEPGLEKSEGESCGEVFEGGMEIDLLLRICETGEKVEDFEEVSKLSGDVNFCNEGEKKVDENGDGLVCCPLYGNDITEFTDELRQVHKNECLDKDGTTNEYQCVELATYQ